MISWKRETAGLWLPCSTVAIEDRGFRYGISLFETVLISSSRAVLIEPHLSRLSLACANVGLPDPNLSATEINRVLSSVQPQPLAGLLRIYVTAGAGGVLDPMDRPAIYMFLETLPSVGQDKALRLRGEPVSLKAVFPGLKTGNYWGHVRALRIAHSEGFDECILVNENNQIVSCALANLFVRVGGRWLTPPCTCGARNGVAREWVMARLAVSVEIFGADVLGTAEAALVTNSRIGPTPVSSIGDRALALTGEYARLRDDWIKEISAEP